MSVRLVCATAHLDSLLDELPADQKFDLVSICLAIQSVAGSWEYVNFSATMWDAWATDEERALISRAFPRLAEELGWNED